MTERLGWTLIHFIWQGALIAAVVRNRIGGSSPDRRCLLGCIALASMMIAPLVTLDLMGQPISRAAHSAAHVTDPRPRALAVYGSQAYPNTLIPAGGKNRASSGTAFCTLATRDRAQLESQRP